MVFNSLEFLVFLCVLSLVYFGAVPASAERARKWTLTVASYLFYASWNPLFVLLMLGSTVLDFVVGLRIDATDSLPRRRTLLALSLVGNLGVLGFFKYGGFALEQWHALWGPDPATLVEPLWEVVLPVGISFYTFQSLSYSIDIYRGAQRPTRSFLDFALFVSFFPQLVAGPIVRSRDFLPQLASRRVVRPSDVELSLVRIAAGLFKKVVLADTIGEYVDSVYDRPNSYGGPNILLGMYAYAYQIYFDFSGYSDIAIGLAGLFGFKIPENFRRPYLSSNPREFWQRWHISLSSWLRDYLYISLGGNRRGRIATYANLLITMLLGGLWHGASWNFVIWGAIHGLWLVLHRAWSEYSGAEEDSRSGRWIRQVLTFHVVCFAWVFFRSPDFSTATLILSRLFTWEYNPHSTMYAAAVGVLIAASLHLAPDPLVLRDRYRRLPPIAQGVGYAAIAIAVALFSSNTGPFIYFQF